MNLDQNIKNWYSSNYNDSYANDYLNPDATFQGLMNALTLKQNIYSYLFIDGEADSIIRENVFAKLAEIKNVDYDVIYQKWLGCDAGELFIYA